MPIALQCSGCSAKMNAPDTAAGKKVKCPKCGATLVVPGATKAAPPAASPAKAPAPAPKAPPPPAAAKKPATPLEEQWLNSPLLAKNRYLTRGKTWVRKYGPEYNLTVPGSDEVLGEANIRAGGLMVFLGLFSLHDFLPRWIEVKDDEGPLFFIKLVKLVNNRYDIYDPSRKELLASVKTVFSTGVALRILDPEGNDNGEVVSTNLPGVGGQSYYGFDVKAADGRKLGDITDEANDFYRRTGKRSYTGGKGYVGTVAPEFASDPRSRVIVLVCTLAARMEDLGVHEFDPMKA